MHFFACITSLSMRHKTKLCVANRNRLHVNSLLNFNAVYIKEVTDLVEKKFMNLLKMNRKSSWIGFKMVVKWWKWMDFIWWSITSLWSFFATFLLNFCYIFATFGPLFGFYLLVSAVLDIFSYFLATFWLLVSHFLATFESFFGHFLTSFRQHFMY